MAESNASGTDDLPRRKRSCSVPSMLPDLSKVAELMTTQSCMRLQPSSSQLTFDSPLKSSSSSELLRPDLTLLLCGRRGTTKALVAKAILDRRELYSSSNTSECVKHQGAACGRWVSLVELPALYGKPQQTVLEESFRCISCCEPEGVHAVVLVLPVGPLTDEDKGELKTIQDTFSSRVNDFTMVLFTVESDPTAPAVVNFVKKNRDIQDLCKSCGGRYFVLNIEDKQQIPEMLDTVEEMGVEGSKSFTKDMFTNAQMSKVVEQTNTNTRLKAELQNVRRRSQMDGGDGNQSTEGLRVVLIGKTGSGKGSTANTILGKKHFIPRISPKPASTSCEEATGEIDGRPVAVVNTPGLFDTNQEELQTCISMLAPGPHVFLLVLQIGNFTQEEENSVELIKAVFGERAADFTIIIFTRGEELNDQSLESYVENCDFVKQLMYECGGRYQVFNNKDQTSHTQVRELLTKIENMLKENGSSCYKTEMFDDTEELTLFRMNSKRISKHKEEEMKRKEAEIKSLRKMIYDQRREIEHERRQREKQDECFQKEREDGTKERKQEERRRKNQEEAQRHEWRRQMEAYENRAKSERDAKERAERNLEQCRRTMKRDQEAWERERKDYRATINRNWKR